MKRYCGSDNEGDESGIYEHKAKKKKKNLLKRLVAEAEERERNRKESLLVNKNVCSQEIPCSGAAESKDTKVTIENEQTVVNGQNEISKIKNSDEQDNDGHVSSDDSHLSDCDNISGKVAVNNKKGKIDKNTEYIILGETDKFKKRKIQRVLPNWLANPITSSALHGKDTNVDEYSDLDDNLCQKLKKSGITEFFPVQQEVMPLLIDINKKRWCCRPNDICVSAPTGSGKTLAFVLPVVQLLKDRVVTAVRCLAVLPVRDLAIQVHKVFKYYCNGTSLSVANITGTMTYAEEQRALGRQGVRGYQSLVDIVIATPGHLIHHIHNTPGFSLQQLRFLILDEADRMMDEIQQGWLTEVEKAIRGKNSSLPNCCSIIDELFCTPKSNIVTPYSIGQVCDPTQKLLYSATLSQDSEKIGQLSLFCPKLFICSSTANSEPNSKLKQKKQAVNDTLPDIEKYTTPAELKEFYALCELSIKPLIVWHLVKTKKFEKVLCFTNSIENSHRLCLVLQEIGEFAVAEYSSRLRGIQRKKAIRKFSSGKIKILVCSDILARGIDIEDIDCVMLYDVPAHARTYVHRIGRTARAGKEGTAITLVENGEKKKFLSLMKLISRNDFTELKVPSSELEPLQERYQTALKMTADNIESERHQKVQKKHPLKRKSQTVKATE